jgi:predicted NBD/HSP70 family sugar kinase
LGIRFSTQVQQHNQKLILSLIKEGKRLPKVDLAKKANLSQTAVASIIRGLSKKGLVNRCKPVKGSVGQPAVPYELNPKGAYSIGIKIGRRSIELALIDFECNVLKTIEDFYQFPDPDSALSFILKKLPQLLSVISKKEQSRICGIGIANPSDVWRWQKEMNVDKSILNQWENFKLIPSWRSKFKYPLHLFNDSNAACVAELASKKIKKKNIVYFFIGWFIGGAAVMDKGIYHGKNNKGGAIGSMPIVDKSGNRSQLIHCASLFILEKILIQKGFDEYTLWKTKDWSGFEEHLQEWLEGTSEAIASSIAAAQSIIDFEISIIDGSMPPAVRERLVKKVQQYYSKKINLQGLETISIKEGTIGRTARSLGAAMLPLTSQFFSD